VRKQGARHLYFTAILEGREAPRAEGAVLGSWEGPAPANDDAQGNCDCKQDVENRPVVLVQAKEKPREGLNRQLVEASQNPLRKVFDIHGTAWLFLALPEQRRINP
jgi:hypothetical protein